MLRESTPVPGRTWSLDEAEQRRGDLRRCAVAIGHGGLDASGFRKIRSSRASRRLLLRDGLAERRAKQAGAVHPQRGEAVPGGADGVQPLETEQIWRGQAQRLRSRSRRRLGRSCRRGSTTARGRAGRQAGTLSPPRPASGSPLGCRWSRRAFSACSTRGSREGAQVAVLVHQRQFGAAPSLAAELLWRRSAGASVRSQNGRHRCSSRRGACIRSACRATARRAPRRGRETAARPAAPRCRHRTACRRYRTAPGGVARAWRFLGETRLKSIGRRQH